MPLVIHERSSHGQVESGNVGQTSPWRKRIKHHQNHQDKAGTWHPSVNEMVLGQDPGDLEGGSFAFGEQSANAAMQIYLKDDGDADNATRVHVRKSDKPKQWMEIAANRGDPNFNLGVAPITDRSTRRVRFPFLWSTGSAPARKATLNWFTRKDRLRKVVRVNGANAPQAFQFRIRLPVGWDLIVRPNGSMAARNVNDTPIFKFPAPYAWDSTGTGGVHGPDESTIEGGPIFSAAFTILDNFENNGNPVYIVEVAITGDTSAAVWPMYLDPTATIDSDAAILDTECRTAKPANNYSSITRAAAYEITGGGTKISAHTQFASGIPDPALYQYDAFRWYWVGANFTGQVANHATMYAVAPGNAPTIASCTWNTKDGSTAWAGGTSGGIGASDIVAATATVISGGGSDQPVNNTSLSTTILDSIAAAGGSSTIVKAPNLQNSTVYGHRTREHADEQYFEIDYSDLPAGGACPIALLGVRE